MSMACLSLQAAQQQAAYAKQRWEMAGQLAASVTDPQSAMLTAQAIQDAVDQEQSKTPSLQPALTPMDTQQQGGPAGGG